MRPLSEVSPYREDADEQPDDEQDGGENEVEFFAGASVEAVLQECEPEKENKDEDKITERNGGWFHGTSVEIIARHRRGNQFGGSIVRWTNMCILIETTEPLSMKAINSGYTVGVGVSIGLGSDIPCSKEIGYSYELLSCDMCRLVKVISSHCFSIIFTIRFGAAHISL